MADLSGFSQVRDWFHFVGWVLSVSPAEQASFLQEEKVGVYELALQFDDAYRLARARMPEGALTEGEARAMSRVHELIDVLDGERPELWEEVALSTSPEWAAVRTAARDFTSAMETNGTPSGRGKR